MAGPERVAWCSGAEAHLRSQPLARSRLRHLTETQRHSRHEAGIVWRTRWTRTRGWRGRWWSGSWWC
jgi:hypothetical protein